MLEATTYGPGIVGNLLAKRVYTHTNNDATADDTDDYYYAYDHIGNVYAVFDSAGAEAYRFNQDAFGNELNFEGYAGSSWSTAATAGIAEHQTGKWIDSFSGLYFFGARWYDMGVGRFVSRSPLPPLKEHPYVICKNNTQRFLDTDGLLGQSAAGASAGGSLFGGNPLRPWGYGPIGIGIGVGVLCQFALKSKACKDATEAGIENALADHALCRAQCRFHTRRTGEDYDSCVASCDRSRGLRLRDDIYNAIAACGSLPADYATLLNPVPGDVFDIFN